MKCKYILLSTIRTLVVLCFLSVIFPLVAHGQSCIPSNCNGNGACESIVGEDCETCAVDCCPQCLGGGVCGDGDDDCSPGDQCCNDATCDWLPDCCGNGIPEFPEQCDDGNNDPGDGCDEFCQNEVPTCGDGGDECVPGADLCCDPDSCRYIENCCGNTTIDPGEQCDDGDDDPCTNNCDENCQFQCGNGELLCGEECEPPGTETCDDQCQDIGPVCDNDGTCDVGENCLNCYGDCAVDLGCCGNGNVEPPEECEPPGGYGGCCLGDCTWDDFGCWDPFCGDGICGLNEFGQIENCGNCWDDCADVHDCCPICNDGNCHEWEGAGCWDFYDCPEDNCEDHVGLCMVCSGVNCNNDGNCDEVDGETCECCPDECGSCCGDCGNGICDPGECYSDCPGDCSDPGECGCEPTIECGEQDCGPLWNGCEMIDCGDCGDVCNDGNCGDSENCNNCIEDCPNCCGDGFCDEDEGDDYCFGEEHCLNCPDDCDIPDGGEFCPCMM